MANNRTTRLPVGVVVFAVCLLAACNQHTVYSHYEHVAPEGWEKEEALDFSLASVPADGDYAEHVGVCISGSYPFSDLTLVIDQTLFPSHQSWSDTVYCRLIDDNGNAQGAGITQYQYTFPVTHVRLYEKDSLHVSIKHDMKRETLPGVISIGLTIEHPHSAQPASTAQPAQ